MNNEIIISSLNANQRLDKFLLRHINRSSKSFIYKMLRTKRIKLNGKKASGNEILKEGDIIKLFISPDTISSLTADKHINPNAGELPIIYEDENIIICNKPQGILVHPEKAGDNDTLVDRVLLHVSRNEECIQFTPSCVNRLDRNTSGIVVAAKNLPSAQWLAKALRERRADKIYLSIVHGIIDKNIEIINSLSKDAAANKVFISENGKLCRTEIEPLEINYGYNYTILRIKLITGRAHQIRAHLESIGNPVAGDKKYASADNSLEKKFNIKNQLLHAYSIEFNEPNGYLGYLSGKLFLCEPPRIFNKLANTPL